MLQRKGFTDWLRYQLGLIPGSGTGLGTPREHGWCTRRREEWVWERKAQNSQKGQTGERASETKVVRKMGGEP